MVVAPLGAGVRGVHLATMSGASRATQPSHPTRIWDRDRRRREPRSPEICRLVGQNNPECLENPHGFVWNHVLALQFHLEVRPEWVHMLAKRDARELVPARFVQSAEEILRKPDDLYRENMP